MMTFVIRRRGAIFGTKCIKKAERTTEKTCRDTESVSIAVLLQSDVFAICSSVLVVTYICQLPQPQARCCLSVDGPLR